MRKPLTLSVCLLLIMLPGLQAQDDLQGMLGDDQPVKNYTIATFKSTRIINGQSVELAPAGEMIFTVSHHFGKINGGLKEYFGLDESTIRMGFEYGVNDWLGLGIGRSGFNKVVDGSVKIRLLRQQTGKKNIPLTAIWYSAVNVTTADFEDNNKEYRFVHRLAYAHQLLLARKFTSNLSVQLSPTFIHFNLVTLETDPNNIPALGAGFRYKLMPRFTVNGEYYYIPDKYRIKDTDPSFSIGVDVETGGHVFQLFLTNSMAIYDPGFIAETYGRWLKGDIYFGFNLTRVFTLVK